MARSWWSRTGREKRHADPWGAGVRELYRDGMVRIVVMPMWVKLIDFEATLPSAVEELIQRQAGRQRA